MALLFTESWDHYTTLPNKGWSVNGNGVQGITAASGRNGTAALKSINFTGRGVNRSIPGTPATVIIGLAYYVDSTADGGDILQLGENGAVHIRLGFDGSGKLVIRRSSTVLATSTNNFPLNAFHYVELKCNLHDTTGSYDVRLDGTSILSASNVDTRNGGTGAGFDNLALGDRYFVNPNLSNNQYWEDVYICDTTGSTNNDFLGDVRIQAIFPTGNGNTSNLVGSDSNSTDNYLLVDEATPNSDTDYVESSTVGDKDTYAMGDVTPTTGTVYGVQIIPFAKKTDAGTRSIASVARLSTTEVDSADKALSTTYEFLPDIRETKPGGGAWSISDVNSAEFGVKVTA